MPHTEIKWNSLSEFVDYASAQADKPVNGRALSLVEGAGWAGTENFAEAQAIAFNWKEGVARIENVKARIQVASQRVRKQAVMREAGPGVLSMGNYLAGHPQPYVALVDSKKAAKGKGKIVSVVVNITASSMVETEVIERRGAAILAMIAALEQAGKRVELTVVSAMSGYGPGSRSHSRFFIRIKKAQQKLNLNSVAFAVAHPSMLRRFVFAAQEAQDEAYRKRYRVGSAHGKPVDVEAEGSIYLGMMHGYDSQWNSEESAAAWVNETLEAQGLTVR